MVLRKLFRRKKQEFTIEGYQPGVIITIVPNADIDPKARDIMNKVLNPWGSGMFDGVATLGDWNSPNKFILLPLDQKLDTPLVKEDQWEERENGKPKLKGKKHIE